MVRDREKWREKKRSGEECERYREKRREVARGQENNGEKWREVKRTTERSGER